MQNGFDSMVQRLNDWLTAQRFGQILLISALVVGVIGYINQHGSFSISAFLGDFYANISSELASIAITVLIIDQLNQRRDRRTNEQIQREQLIRQLGSTVNLVAKRAAEELRAKGWLTDGTVQEVDLRAADLEDARLWDADLQGVNLQWAKLMKANLNGAILVGANLTQANLTAAKMRGADLRQSNFFEAKLYRVQFYDADLQNADLSGAHLENAKFENANLRNARLDDVFIDEDTVLPDGQHWTPDADLTRFTNPDHPQFWRPDLERAAQRASANREE